VQLQKNVQSVDRLTGHRNTKPTQVTRQCMGAKDKTIGGKSTARTAALRMGSAVEGVVYRRSAPSSEADDDEALAPEASNGNPVASSNVHDFSSKRNFITRPTLNFTVRLAGTGTLAIVLGF